MNKKFNLNKTNSLKVECTLNLVEQHTFPNGRSFPSSYTHFVSDYGYGLSMGLFLIYIPIESHPDSFFIRSKAIMSTYQNVLDNEDELWFDLGNDLQYSNLKHLIPFASSENGHYLFWDISSHPKENEFDIYITDFRALPFTCIGHDLYQFFDKVTSSDTYKQVLPFSQKPLPKTFDPFHIVADKK